jgi:hypothetical protein
MPCAVLYCRERNDGLYRPVVYLAHKVVEELLLIAPVLAGTCAIVWYGVQLQGSFLLFWLISYATLANGIGESGDGCSWARGGGWTRWVVDGGLCMVPDNHRQGIVSMLVVYCWMDCGRTEVKAMNNHIPPARACICLRQSMCFQSPKGNNENTG